MNNSIRKKTKDLNKHYTKEDNQMAIKHMKSSVQFSRSVVSNPLRHHELQHARPPCPSPTPRVYSNASRELQIKTTVISLCTYPEWLK